MTLIKCDLKKIDVDLYIQRGESREEDIICVGIRFNDEGDNVLSIGLGKGFKIDDIELESFEGKLRRIK